MSSEEFEQSIKEARMAGLKGDIKTSMIKYVRCVQIINIRYINVMSQLESQIDNSSEEEKPVLKAKLQECVDEYNTLRSGHPDITIFTDELDRHSVVDDVLSGVSSAIQYGISGITSLLETAAIYGTVAMGDLSNYIADYLDDGESTIQTDESESVVENSLSREASVQEPVTIEKNTSMKINHEDDKQDGVSTSIQNKDSELEHSVRNPVEIAVEVQADSEVQPVQPVQPVTTEQPEQPEQPEETTEETTTAPSS